MKCYADERDHCHNPSACDNAGKCTYEKESNKVLCNQGIICHDSACEFTGRCKWSKLGAELNPIEEKPRIPEFIEILEASKAIHLRKNRDYANDNNPFSNFERSAELISWFNNPIDRSFIALIGTKLARIAELSDGRTPNNESLDDSFLDLVTYCGLWAAYSKRNRRSNV